MPLTIYGDNYIPSSDNRIEISFMAGLIIFSVVWFAARALICFFKKKLDIRHEALMLLMYVNLAVIFRFTFFPLEHAADGSIQPFIIQTDEIFPPWLNLVPFRNMFDFVQAKHMVINITGNVLMFVPTGIILPVIYKKLRSFPRTVLAGGLISLGIELLQIPCTERASDVDDLILNTAGVVLGYGIYALARRIRKKI